MTRFAAIDIETANPDITSICQIGIAIYEQEKLVDTWETKVNPESYFRDINISIHGITPDDVITAPKRHEIIKDIERFLHGSNVASYGAFDRSSINQAYPDQFQINWLDVTTVVRRTYENLTKKGYGLGNVCSLLDIDLINHHNALADAIAAGEVLIRTAKDSGLSINDWFAGKSIPKRNRINIQELSEPNENGNLFGEVIAFTGSLSVSRSYAEGLALKAGCTVGSGVTKKTTLLVVGTQDLSKIKGSTESAKELKAKQLIASGQDIKILFEDDFFKLIEKTIEPNFS